MNLSQYRKKAEHLSQPENFKEAVKKNWTVPVMGAIFALALWIRMIPEKGMQYLQALDPYMIYRMSQHLALSGNLPALDFTRYFPYATPIYTMNLGDIVIPALMYRYLGFSLIFPSYMEYAQFYPAFMGAIGVVAMYFLGKELFDRFTGVSAAFFLATLSGVMHRTSAGFFEKEPTGTALMLISMVFFTEAWKNRDWKHGIISGLTFGLFSISWGGSKMLWLLYPLIVGAVLFIDEDIRSMIAAYTPTIMLGAVFASAFNPARFWLTDKFFLANLGLLALLWSRYLVEKYEIIEDDQLVYYTPVMYVLGGLMAALSPLYSDYLGSKVIGLWNQATQSGAGVIAGTVAENQAATLSSLVSSLSINSAAFQVLPIGPLSNLLGVIANFISPWMFMILGIPILGTHILTMIARKYDVLDEIPGKQYYSYLEAVTISWLITATMFLASNELAAAFMPQASRAARTVFAANLRNYSIIAGVLSLGILSTVTYYLKDEAYKILLIVFGFFSLTQVILALNVVGSGSLRIISYALFRSAYAKALFLPALTAFIVFTILWVLRDYSKPELGEKWYLAIPFFFILSNLLAASSRSRLVFLSGFSVSLIAGYGLVKAVRKFQELDLSGLELDYSKERIQDAKLVVIAVLGAIMIIASIVSGFAMAQQLGGSPSQAWDPALNYMENETPAGSVILSWWDYGYWFESIGRRAAVADGGNFGYYSGSQPKINYPLADFLTASNASEHKDFLKIHSVDYIALDRSMIGKYSAVSQISRRSNQNFSSMRTLTTPQPINQYLNSQEQMVQFNARGLRAFAPVNVGGQQTNGSIQNLSININGPVTLRTGSSTLKIDCLLTDQGRVDLGNTSERRTIPYCVAERPAPDFELAARTGSSAGLVMVPEKIADSTLVKLYLMDGHGIDFVEKKDVSRFEYVKMWEVKDLE